MSVWKIIAGAAIGVGAVAAAPFTGGGSVLGAATLMGSLTGAGIAAGVAGAAGAAAGAAVNAKSKKKEEEIRKEGYKEGKAEYSLKIDILKMSLAKQMSDIAKREQFIHTAFAVAFCAAQADGEICDEEMQEIDIFIAGIGTSELLSKKTKKAIEKMKSTPPNLSTVWALINKFGFADKKYLDIFSNVIEIVILADHVEKEAEISFRNSWNSLIQNAA